MRETRLNKLTQVPIDDVEYTIVDAGGGPGVVALIVSSILQESLEAIKAAEILSPHFPQVTLINNEGVAAPPKIEVYLARPRTNQRQALLIVTRNFIIETTEVGEEVSEILLNYLPSSKISALVVLTSGRVNASGEVYASSTDMERVRRLVRLGAKAATNIETLPVDRLTSSLMLRFHLNRIPMDLLISDTMGLAPDLASAKKVLAILSGYLGIPVDTSKLDAEIEKQQQLLREASRFFEEMERRGSAPSYIG
ncbi:hypothetical protein HRbin02_00823 [Candidatus Calditenuaceae archaeon HR02]|nr:hypothetical protein HRbin02_00823 [Candidatus Calditenuaceae archaeon HR02]